MDDDQTIVIADSDNNRIVEWKSGARSGEVLAGGNGRGNKTDQLNEPTDMIVDEETDSLIICDSRNRRVWVKDATEGIVVAGGRGPGDALTQLSRPQAVFVDNLDTIYVTDEANHRVIRWCKGATHGDVIVGQDQKEKNELNAPNDFSFDRHGNLYVSSNWNHAVLRFSIETR
ncbi:unnamed protein product [Rotaria sp. Silwood1]|nr:unnamed protein product [Rotaria sp. Silwood1]CAF4978528.1 unnamed protein product [Rotaria sp. Silwood1]